MNKLRRTFLGCMLVSVCIVSAAPASYAGPAVPDKPSPSPSLEIHPTPRPAAALADGATPDKNSQNPEVSEPYLADMARRIKRAWFPPKGNEAKIVMVTFILNSEGAMSELKLLKSSGLAIADSAALKAVENAAPFRPLPLKASKSAKFEFDFDYEHFNGGGRATALPPQ